MDRIDGDDVGIALHRVAEGAHHGGESVGPVLSAMPRDHDAAGMRADVRLIPTPDRGDARVEIGEADNGLDGIDHGITGDDDRGRIDPLGEEVVAGGRGGGEVEVGGRRDDPPVDLLRVGLPTVVGPQARLDMPHLHPHAEGGDRRAHRRGRIPLAENPIGARRFNRLGNPRDRQARQLDQRRPLGEEMEAVIDRHPEQLEDGVEHRLVLPGGAEDWGREAFGHVAQLAPHRGHLDALRPRASDEHDPWAVAHAREASAGSAIVDSDAPMSGR